MSFQQEPHSNSLKTIKVKFDLDEMDIEEFDFKPVTKGLGFHQKDTERASAPRISRPTPSASERPMVAKQVRTAPSTQFISQSELSGLYNTAQTKVATEKAEVKKALIVETYPASTFSRSAAFAVDLLIILSGIGFVFWSSTYVLGIQVDLVKEFSVMSELSIVSVILCSLMFVFYFSILDLGQTPGKSLFNIGLKSEKGDDLKISQTFMRSIVTLFSVYLLFLPLILDFQSKLSETKVVKQ